MSDNHRPNADNPELERPELTRPEDEAIEAEAATAAAASDTFEQAADGMVIVPAEHAKREETRENRKTASESQPTRNLERLQKILAQAGIASRRHAEELITQGRVQVNGKVVTELGSKADAARDHIRVDGKLLRGSERLRYFMLNKPRGFVTTVSDPEGRPTVMQFFSKLSERLYPVGRLDYMSEGLLLVTNDGELANKLTRAASGVEKTYLVKVSGQPAERDLDRLREGVGIDRGKPGTGRVQTAPAQIRRVRRGDKGSSENPWFEVVLIEGRNRELRKMFEEVGHHVEKIRRVGYGPLVLDLEPGKMRELEPQEIEDLRKAAEGKYRKPKARENRRSSAGESRFASGESRRQQQQRNIYRSNRGEEKRRSGQFGANDRFEGRGRQQPPRLDRSENRSGEKKGFGGRHFRREFGRRAETATKRPERRPFSPERGKGQQRSPGPEQQRSQFTGKRQQGPAKHGRFGADREDRRFGHQGQGQRGAQWKGDRPPGEDRRRLEPRSGTSYLPHGFNARPGSRKGDITGKTGSIRSGGGRRPGSRPGQGQQPGSRPGGRKRG